MSGYVNHDVWKLYQASRDERTKQFVYDMASAKREMDEIVSVIDRDLTIDEVHSFLARCLGLENDHTIDIYERLIKEKRRKGEK